jgi:hypothetical protein
MDKLTGKELEEAIIARQIANKAVSDAAAMGDPICGAFASLEASVRKQGLGNIIDYQDYSDEDDEDRPY